MPHGTRRTRLEPARRLRRYNSTVFAYGQTGSGKTFTITGGPERYADRGIIPRAMSAIFAAFRERADAQWTAHISYLEVAWRSTSVGMVDPCESPSALPLLHRQPRLSSLVSHLSSRASRLASLVSLSPSRRRHSSSSSMRRIRCMRTHGARRVVATRPSVWVVVVVAVVVVVVVVAYGTGGSPRLLTTTTTDGDDGDDGDDATHRSLVGSTPPLRAPRDAHRPLTTLLTRY